MSKPFSEFYQENKKVTKKLFQKNPVAMIKALRAIVHEMVRRTQGSAEAHPKPHPVFGELRP